MKEPADTTGRTHRRRRVSGGGRDPGVVSAVAVAATAAFAGGGLLTQTVLVPHWRAMEPAAFLRHFATWGPATGATLFPIEVVSLVLLARTTYGAIQHRRPGRRWWGLATACIAGTILFVPIYFWGANRAMLDPGFPPQAVARELSAWYRWNWLRTGLALVATGLSCAAMAPPPDPAGATVH